MKMQKFLVVLLAVMMLIGTMVFPTSAAGISVIDDAEYEDELMLSAYWTPHASNRRDGKILLSDDVPYKSSKKSICFEYDVSNLGWVTFYYAFVEPDAVEYKDYLTFMIKGTENVVITPGLVQKDLGFNLPEKTPVTTEWTRVVIPLSDMKDGGGESILDSIRRELWITNFSFSVSRTYNANMKAEGKIWMDDIAFVSKADLDSLPKVDAKPTTTTKKPTTTAAKPTTTTKKPTTTATKAPITTQGSSTTESTIGESTTGTEGITTTTTGGIGDAPVEATGTLTVLDSLIKLDGDKLSVPNGMTVSNVLSRLRVETGYEMAIMKDGAAVAATEKVTSDMKLTVSKDGSELKTYELKVGDSASTGVSSNNGWVLPVCIVAGVIVVAAAVLLIVFRKKIFK